MNVVRGTPFAPVALPVLLESLRELPIPHKYGVLDRIYGTALATSGVCWVRCQNGNTWMLDLANQSHRWCVYHSIFPPLVANWLRQLLKSGGTIIDSGANIGQAAIEFAWFDNCQVHCFEPLPEAAQWLQDCLEAKKLKNLSIVRYGLFSEETKLELQVAGAGEQHGAQSTLRQDWYGSRGFQRITVPLLTLDDYASQTGIKEIVLWKLDIEGSEEHALAGARHLLSNGRIHALYVEVSNPQNSKVQEILACFGYKRYGINKLSATCEISDQITRMGDYLFLRSS